MPDVEAVVLTIPGADRHAAALALVADTFDLLVDPTGTLAGLGSVLAGERREPGSRRREVERLSAVADELDAAAAAARRGGDLPAYLSGFQCSRAISALAALVSAGEWPSSVQLADVAYEAVMATGRRQVVLARLAGGS
ncbi:hypothetical protein P0W64_17190 [Tsukamurella sp. 8F]|uniref:hypothetical protein n=1 Tax=unclassified Tsukamurella TaxID=2633480 RepID=UPI0023B8AFC9|nr:MULTISPECIES: hypothetical protein [unclassified Tsukamurella]MDF0531251.1 hypothetical protein [Tsukamurella sp. 8J]MDF0588520.1 hypothetical protein [Tsukamurella sp. 8F]